MRIAASLFLLILVSFSLPGQKVLIQGNGKGYSGKEIRIEILSDPISEEMIPLKKVKCDSTGSFNAELPLEGRNTVFLRTGIFCFFFYATGIAEYNLKLPEYVGRTDEESQNLYFTETRLMPEITGNPGDINNSLRLFDAGYNELFNRILDRVIYNVKKEEIPSLIESLNKVSTLDTNMFFRNFVKYRFIMLNMAARGEFEGRIEDSASLNKVFDHENPAYTDLVNQAFSGLFTTLSAGAAWQKISNAIAAADATALLNAVMEERAVSNRNLAEYITLLNLYQLYFSRTESQGNFRQIIKSLALQSSSDYIRKLALDLVSRFEATSAGAVAPGFRLPDAEGKIISPGSFRGKYLLLSFARSDNAFSVSEYGVLRNFYKKFSDSLAVVTILMDEDFKRAADILKNIGCGWSFLDGHDGERLEYLYNIKMYPSFILIDKKGQILYPKCPFPSENLEGWIRNKLFVNSR